MSIDVVPEKKSIISQKKKTLSQKLNKQKLSSYTDQAWKEILNIFFKEFLELCWPQIHQDINWDIPYEVLEQELHKIGMHNVRGKRVRIRVY